MEGTTSPLQEAIPQSWNHKGKGLGSVQCQTSHPKWWDNQQLAAWWWLVLVYSNIWKTTKTNKQTNKWHSFIYVGPASCFFVRESGLSSLSLQPYSTCGKDIFTFSRTLTGLGMRAQREERLLPPPPHFPELKWLGRSNFPIFRTGCGSLLLWNPNPTCQKQNCVVWLKEGTNYK